MDTARDNEFGDNERTVPDEIADLDVEVQAMFERVRVRLGLRTGGPEMIGRYELRDWIARGGMGQVYRAYDAELEREVAIKLVAPRPGSDPQVLRKRLLREAQLLAKLDHENVVSVYDVGVHQGRVYLVMELVDGATLRERQVVGKLSASERLRLYAEAGRGLLAAHERGVVHRDFKPDNVFVGDDGRARVGDFGLAHVLGEVELEGARSGEARERPSRLTQDGEVVGTLGYMAPEQLRGERSDARADQYSFCVSLWEALGERRPFPGASPRTVLEAMSGEPEGGDTIDRRLRRVLRVGLAVRPEDRHPSMAELVAAIEELLERPARRRRRLNYGLLGLAAVIGLLVGRAGYRAANPDCPLAETLASARIETDWAGFAARSSGRTAKWFKDRLAAMEDDAKQACVSKDRAALQHLESSLSSLQSLLDSAGDNGWSERVRRFELDFASKASAPMTDEGYAVLASEIEPLEHDWKLRELVTLCNSLERGTWEGADRAEFLLHCGRARSITGDYARAVASFKQARSEAEFVGDGQRRLEANLEAAKTLVMRQEQYERGDELLAKARDLLHSLEVGVYDPRRADFDELQAVLAEAEGDFVEALNLQRRVVGPQLLFGTNEDRAPALTNLGVLHVMRDRPAAAEYAYRLALYFDPSDPEAALNLGCLLVNEERADDEARSLLKGVLKADNHDLHLIATTCLLSLEIYGDDLATTEALAGRLHKLLRHREIPRTRQQERQSWQIVTLAFARVGELGPDYEFAWGKVPVELRAQLGLAIADLPKHAKPEEKEDGQ